MLRQIPRPEPPDPSPADRVRGDGAALPFSLSSFGEVALLGNVIGFSGPESERLLEGAERMVRPEGRLMVEIAPGPGERSRYLARLPIGSAVRVLASPPRLVVPRILREGFSTEPSRHPSDGFARLTVEELTRRWAHGGFEVEEVVAVAPSLGPDALRVEQARMEPKTWDRLLETEETVGRQPERWRHAAAVLLAARRITSVDMVKTRPTPSGIPGHDAEALRAGPRREPAPRRHGRPGGRP
jgi:hypothetical protein